MLREAYIMLKGLQGLGNLVAGVFETPVVPVEPVDLDRTLKAIGLEELNDKGYINLPDFMCPVDPDFNSKDKAIEHETGAYIRHMRKWDPLYSRCIHPIFLPRRWKDVSIEDYDLMLPSIVLASRFLDEPQILTYVKGFLAKPLQPINDEAAIQNAGEPLYTFRNAPLQSWALSNFHDEEKVWSVLWNLKDCLTLQFTSKITKGCVGVTGPGDKPSTVEDG